MQSLMDYSHARASFNGRLRENVRPDWAGATFVSGLCVVSLPAMIDHQNEQSLGGHR